MKEYLPVISSSRLFSGITETEALSMLECLSARTAYYEKNEQILQMCIRDRHRIYAKVIFSFFSFNQFIQLLLLIKTLLMHFS